MSIHFIIVGISSHLGISICRQLMNQNCNITGTYKNLNKDLQNLQKEFQDKKLPLDLHRLDVLDRISLREFSEKIIKLSFNDIQKVCFIYCCGSWHCGPVEKLQESDIESVINIGLIAPFILTSYFLRIKKAVRIILITGLGGEKNAIKYNSLYGTVTSGIYNLVRTTGMELAGSDSYCIGLALSLFDKGQSYVADLCENLKISKLVAVENIVNFIIDLSFKDSSYLNGSVIEMGGEIFNYSDIIQFLLLNK